MVYIFPLSFQACVDVRASSVFWQQMELAETIQGQPKLPEWLSTHPSHENRAEHLDRLIPEVSWVEGSVSFSLSKVAGISSVLIHEPLWYWFTIYSFSIVLIFLFILTEIFCYKALNLKGFIQWGKIKIGEVKCNYILGDVFFSDFLLKCSIFAFEWPSWYRCDSVVVLVHSFLFFAILEASV